MTPRDPDGHRAAMGRMRQHRRLMNLIDFGMFGAVCLGLAYALVLAATVPPEAVGRWIGRVMAGARSAA